MLEVQCPNCQSVLLVPENFVGQQGRCKNCDKIFIVPPPAFDTKQQKTYARPYLSHFLNLNQKQKSVYVIAFLSLCILVAVIVFVIRKKETDNLSIKSKQITPNLQAAASLYHKDILPPLMPNLFPTNHKDAGREQSPEATQIVSIGTEGICKGIHSTVYSIYQWQDTFSHPTFPNQGNYFIALDIEVKNYSREKLMVNPYNFYAVNEKGQKFSHPFMVGKPEPDFATRALQPSDIARGWIVLEVPLDAVDLYLVYEINMFRGEEIRFRLK